VPERVYHVQLTDEYKAKVCGTAFGWMKDEKGAIIIAASILVSRKFAQSSPTLEVAISDAVSTRHPEPDRACCICR